MKKLFAQNIVRVQNTYELNNTDTSYLLSISRRTLGRIHEKALTEGQIQYTPSNRTVAKVARAMHVAPREVTTRLPAATIASVF